MEDKVTIEMNRKLAASLYAYLQANMAVKGRNETEAAMAIYIAFEQALSEEQTDA